MYVDKRQWPDGPWQYEPDYSELVYKGYPCTFVREPTDGYWIGYVFCTTIHNDLIRIESRDIKGVYGDRPHYTFGFNGYSDRVPFRHNTPAFEERVNFLYSILHDKNPDRWPEKRRTYKTLEYAYDFSKKVIDYIITTI